MTDNVLLIAKNWPEPNSTAAGRRTLDILKLFIVNGHSVHVASAAEQTPFQTDLKELGIQSHKITVNDSTFDSWLEALSPDIVIFDRYIMEEQFGWRVQATIPAALTLLDTSDLHFLREARHQAFKTNTPVDLFSDTAVRELTCISRCDICIVISQVERELLLSKFSLSEHHVLYLPFLVDAKDLSIGQSFETRQHCVMFGGFKHEPNRDATRWLQKSLWPEMKKSLPNDTQMHVYGAYADHSINQLNSPKDRFFIKGRVDDSLATIQQYRINIAPLRFGAGQKGKILEGWLTGTPTITTAVGAESMMTSDQYRSAIADTEGDFSQAVADTYTNKTHWQNLQAESHFILRTHFMRSQHASRFLNSVYNVKKQLAEHRHNNFWGRVLSQNQFKASKYMSRWIEVKNKNKPI